MYLTMGLCGPFQFSFMKFVASVITLKLTLNYFLKSCRGYISHTYSAANDYIVLYSSQFFVVSVPHSLLRNGVLFTDVYRMLRMKAPCLNIPNCTFVNFALSVTFMLL